MERFERFICYLSEYEDACRVAARLQREGVNLPRVLAELAIYVEGRSISAERRKRGKQFRAIVNRGARKNGLAPAVASWLLDRSELAHATHGLGQVHNIDSLASLHIYLELQTGRRVTMSELAFLVEAANWALGRKPTTVDPNTIGRELRRHKQKNPRFISMLRENIASRLSHG